MKKYKKEIGKEELLNINDDEIDTSDIAELDDNFWKNAKFVKSQNKKAISLRINPDTLEWFKKQGKGYQTLMNDVLSSYASAHRNN